MWVKVTLEEKYGSYNFSFTVTLCQSVSAVNPILRSHREKKQARGNAVYKSFICGHFIALMYKAFQFTCFNNIFNSLSAKVYWSSVLMLLRFTSQMFRNTHVESAAGNSLKSYLARVQVRYLPELCALQHYGWSDQEMGIHAQHRHSRNGILEWVKFELDWFFYGFKKSNKITASS